MAADVHKRFSAQVRGAATTVDLYYDQADPHAVLIRAATVHGPHVWRVARDTLRDGAKFREVAFDLVCRVEPLGESGQVRVSLHPDGGPRLVFDMNSAELLAALDATAELVPFGPDHVAVDWDSALREVRLL